MKEKDFEEELREFNEKKKDIENNAKNSIRELAKDIEENALRAGYVYDGKFQSFKRDYICCMELILTCQGRDIYPSPKVLVHRISEVDENVFNKYVSSFNDTVPGKMFSIEARQNVVELSKTIAVSSADFFNAFSACFEQHFISDAKKTLEDQGLDIFKYPRLYPKGCHACTPIYDCDIVDYYGGFEYYLPSIQCEIHFFTATRPSFKKMTSENYGLWTCTFNEATPIVRVKADDVVFF